MRQNITIVILSSFFSLFTTSLSASELGIKASSYSTYAQGKTKAGAGNGISKGLLQLDFSLNFGSNAPFYVSDRYRRGYPDDYDYRYVGFRPGFTLNIDGAVHPYASVGGYFGLDGGLAERRVRRGVVYYNRNIGIGFGARGVFHIYQLIADKTNTKASPSKLDFYFAMHLGGVIYFNTGPDVVNNGYSRSFGGVSFGPGIGVRYYFNSKIGIITEVGWNEMSVFKLGLAAKL